MVLCKLFTSREKAFFRGLLMKTYMKESEQLLFRLNKGSRQFN